MYTRLCSGCGVERTYSDKNKYERAEAAKSMCRKCANTKTNKTISRKGSENAAWTGYKDVPGKIFSRLRNGAKQRNIEVTITIEDIYTQYIKQHKQCAFTGVPLEFGLDASVDRINSQEGYHVWNIQIVHKTLNMMKKDMPNDLFISWCRMVKGS
jgi:hypothetical protein